MTQTLFDLTFYLAVPFWVLMIFVPGWSWTKRIIGTPLIILPPLVPYFVLLAPIFRDFAAAMLRPSLSRVNDVVSTVEGTAALWAHLVAFDLFIGRWMYFDSRDKGIHPLAMAPVMVLTILLSPIGVVVYLILRSVAGRSSVEVPAAASDESRNRLA